MKKAYKPAFALFAMITLLTCQTTAIAETTPTGTNNRLYIGGALGFSKLKPRVLTPDGRVTDDSSTGGKIYAGYDVGVRDFWFVEGFYADLGSAGIDTGSVTGDIDYRLLGVNLLYKRPFSARFKGLVKLGYADVKNDTSNNITYRQVENGDVFLGIGAEVPVNKHLNIRGEYEYFDKDIKLFGIGLNYRF